MKSEDMLSEKDLKQHPINPNWTMPKSFGVWELPDGQKGKKYPAKGLELDAEFGSNKRIALYASRKQAKARAEELNQQLSED